MIWYSEILKRYRGVLMVIRGDQAVERLMPCSRAAGKKGGLFAYSVDAILSYLICILSTLSAFFYHLFKLCIMTFHIHQQKKSTVDSDTIEHNDMKLLMLLLI